MNFCDVSGLAGMLSEPLSCLAENGMFSKLAAIQAMQRFLWKVVRAPDNHPIFRRKTEPLLKRVFHKIQLQNEWVPCFYILNHLSIRTAIACRHSRQ